MRTNFERPSPVVLSSNCDVADFSINVPRSDQLSYPFRRALLIDEIRFDLRSAFNLGITGLNVPNLGAVVGVKLTLGQSYLMRDYVPIWLLGTTMSLVEEQQKAIDPPAAASTGVAYSQYRWRLPEPLYIEAGQILQASFSRAEAWRQNTPFPITASINTQISYAGRTVPPGAPRPTQILMPYVAPFVTPWGQVYDQSNENDLFNPFDDGKNLRIQRMTGRVLSSQDGGVGKPIVQAVQVLTPATAGSAMTVLMNDSWGGKMVNNNTGPSDIWDCVRDAWTYDTTMPEKGVYELRVWNIPASQQLHVAMIGSRLEGLSS